MLSRWSPLVALIVTGLATFLVSFEYWALILVVLGLVHGVVQPVDESATKTLLVVAAVGFPARAKPWCDPGDWCACEPHYRPFCIIH